MAGWVCQTRKMLSTVMSSLADDLEQTAQGLNDTIHRLNLTNGNVTFNRDQPEINDPAADVPNDKPLQRSIPPAHQVQQKNLNFEPVEHYSTATTRQPVKHYSTATTRQPVKHYPTATTRQPVKLYSTATTRQPVKHYSTATTRQPVKLYSTATMRQPVKHYSTATTKQPETSGFPSAMSPRLSRASPSSQIPRDRLLHPTELEPIDSQKAVTDESSVLVRSPESSVLVRSPESSVLVRSPEPLVLVRSPEPSVVVRSPEPLVLVRSPESSVVVRSPESSVVVRSPESSVLVRSPESSVLVRSPESSVVVRSPESSVLVRSPESSVLVRSPESSVVIMSPKPSYCPLSEPSTCLSYVSKTNSEKEHHKIVYNISDPEPVSLEQYSIARTTYANIRPDHSRHVCPCHGRESFKRDTNSFGMKRPGKVIRAFTLAKEGPGQKLPSETDQELAKAGDDIEKVSSCGSDESSGPALGMSSAESSGPALGMSSAESSGPALGMSSALVVVERESCLLRWAPLWPLSSMLSYAVTQLTNLVHLLTTEPPHNLQSLTSPEIMSQTIPRNNVKASEALIINHGQRSLSKRDETEMAGHDVYKSTLHGRTFSTESFVVIDSSSFYDAPEEHRFNQNKVSGYVLSSDPGSGRCKDAETELLESHGDCLYSGHPPGVVCGHVTEVISSSAEWVSFDVGKLIRDRNFDAWSPDSEECLELEQVIQPVIRRSDCGSGFSRENDDDGDSSVSFTVLSDIDDGEDGFIFF